MGDECPVCQRFGSLCDALREKSPDKGVECWRLLLDFIEGKIDADKLAEDLLKLDRETVTEWITEWIKKKGKT